MWSAGQNCHFNQHLVIPASQDPTITPSKGSLRRDTINCPIEMTQNWMGKLANRVFDPEGFLRRSTAG
jgi:hypothetical protein